MSQKVFVTTVALLRPLYFLDMSPYEAALLSLRHYVSELTPQKIRDGAVDFPDGEGEYYLLPALVEPDDQADGAK
jgi:hypothetical protein